MRVLAVLLLSAAVAVAQTTTVHRWNRRDPVPWLDGGAGCMVRDQARGINVLLSPSVTSTPGLFQITTWEWADTRWCRRAVVLPQSLRDAALTFDPNRGCLLLYGSNQVGQTWLYDGTSWTQVPGAGTPGVRTGHALGTDLQRGRVVLFGGQDGASNLLGDTWEWDGNAWTRQNPASAPLPRTYARMAFNPATGRVALFGGSDMAWLNYGIEVVYEWTGSTWLAINSGNPQLRYMSALAVTSDLAGGVWALTPMDSPPYLNQLRYWNGTTWTLAPTSHEAQLHLLAESPDRLFAFGGRTAHLGTFAYTPSQNRWDMLQPGDNPLGGGGSFGCVEPWDGLLFTQYTGPASTELWRLDQDGTFTWLLHTTYDTSNPQLMAYHPPSGHELFVNPYTGVTASYDGRAVVTHAGLPLTSGPSPIGQPYLVGFHPASGRVLGLMANAQQNIEIWGWAPSAWALLAVGPRMTDLPIGAMDGARNRLVLGPIDGSAMWEWDGSAFTPIAAPPAGAVSFAMLPHPEGGVTWIRQSMIHRWDGMAWTSSVIVNSLFGVNYNRMATHFDSRRRRWVAYQLGVLWDLEPRSLDVDEPAPLPGRTITFTYDRIASASRPWLTLLSTSDAPGIPWRPSAWYGTEIVPLANDWLLGASLGLGLGGVLDAQGRGQVQLAIPNLPLTGFRCFAAAVTFGTAQPLEFVSRPVTICIRR